MLQVASGTDNLIWSTFYVANLKGYFKQRGIITHLTHVKSGPNVAAALLSGSVDIGLQALSTPIVAESKGEDLVFLAPVDTRVVSDLVVSRAFASRHGITASLPLLQRVRLLKGAKIATAPPNDARTVQVKIIARAAGLNPSRDLHLVPIGVSSQQVAVLEAGTVDGFEGGPPEPQIVEHNRKGFTLVNFGSGVYAPFDFPANGVVVTRSWLKGHRKVAVRFVAALIQAYRYIHQHPTEAARLLHSMPGFQKLSNAVFNQAFTSLVPAFPTTPKITRAEFQKALAFARETNPRLKTRFSQAVNLTVGADALKLVNVK